jgi:hypothetical protein
MSVYLEGAVPEVDGKVVFTKEFSVPGLQKSVIFDRVQKWMEKRLAANGNDHSRVVYVTPEDGVVAGVAEEWLIFKSNALTLDRTWMGYNIKAECADEHCKVQIEKIRYVYEQTQKYKAEEMVTDRVALNKAKTKIIIGLRKWRIKTIDFANDTFDAVAKAIGTDEQVEAAEKAAAEAAAKAKKSSKVVINTASNAAGDKAVTVVAQSETPVVVAPSANASTVVAPSANNATAVVAPVVDNASAGNATAVVAPSANASTVVAPAVAQPQDTVEVIRSVQPRPVAIEPQPAAQSSSELKEIAASEVSRDAIKVGEGRLVIVIGEDDPFNMSIVTANGGGSVGRVSDKPVVFSILSPDQSYDAVEKAESYKVKFYPTGTTSPSLILECRKVAAPAPFEGQPRTYIGEIVKAWTK